MNAPCIETARLLLRPYTRDNLDALHRLWTDPDVRCYLFDDETVARAWVAAEIEHSLACFETQGFGQWAMFLKGHPALIGFCGYRSFHNPPEVQLIYGLAPDHWGQGLAPEAARALIRYGFETLGFDEIIASTDTPNEASIRVMEKTGMTFQKRVFNDGLDMIYYAVSRADFQADDSFYRVRRVDA